MSSISLLTDLYQLTMGQAYFEAGMKDTQAVFHLFYRKEPFKGNYAINCGLRTVIDFIKKFSFSDSDITYLKSLKGNDNKPLFSLSYLEYLAELSFLGDIDAIEEGRVVFAHEPLLRVKASVIVGLLLETPLLNIINFQTLIATKASRVCLAAQGDKVLEFGLRRAQGIDGSLSATYACVVGGVHATSNVLAGKLFGIPVKGTHAHSWIMSFDSEEEAFDIYSKHMPNNCIFLVDTYDTKKGIENAIIAGKKLQESGHKMLGIRLDSGDLNELSQLARKMLDDAELHDASIVASNDLDEYTIQELKKQGAKIDTWGVGTKLVTAYDQPALGGVYKLSAIDKNGEWEYKLKKSEDLIKVSNPGILNVRRVNSKELVDIIINEDENESKTAVMLTSAREVSYTQNSKTELLLKPIFKEGKYIYSLPNFEEINRKRIEDMESLSPEIFNFSLSSKCYVGMDKKLFETKQELLSKL